MSLIQKIKSILSTADVSRLTAPRQYVRERSVISDAMIDDAIKKNSTNDMMIAVMWVDIHADTQADFERCWAPHSRTLKAFYAVEKFMNEVSNGGYEQYFTNSAGDFCEDALYGCQLFGLTEHHALLAKAVERLGGEVPFDQYARWDLMEERRPDFDELDYAHYRVEGSYETAILTYADAHREEFYFDAMIERPAY